MPSRQYATLLSIAATHAAADRPASMKLACDLVWDHFGLNNPARPAYSWIGFYEKSPASDDMILVARRDKPACSPIGLHGMCGRSWRDRRPVLIQDVSTLGADYIACDPKDRSEIVVPLFGPRGDCWGVLDGDSYECNAFDDADVAGLTALVECLGLSAPGNARPPTLRL